MPLIRKMLKTSALKRSQLKLCYLQIDEVHWLMINVPKSTDVIAETEVTAMTEKRRKNEQIHKKRKNGS